MTSGTPARSRASGLVPTRLSTRLTLTMVVASVIVFSVIATAVSITFSNYVRSATQARQINGLTETAFIVELQARELESYLVSFAEWSEFYQQTLALDPAFIAAELDPWLPDRSGATTLVWLRADGTVLHARGSQPDVEALTMLASGGATSGAVLLPSGPTVVATRGIVGDPAAPSVGALAIARQVRGADLPAGISITEPSGADELTTANGWREVYPPRGYGAAFTDLRGGALVSKGALRGLDGQTAFVVEVSEPDPWMGGGRAWFVVLVPIALGLVTVGAGFALGSVLSRSIGRPLTRFVSYMRDQGYLALQGLRVDEDLVVDPALPAEFNELSQVIMDLMTQLRINQSELIEAGEQALAAERAFRTVVEESPEVKILVREGIVEIANPAAAHFFGLHLGDLLRAEPSGIFSGVALFNEDDEPLDLARVGELATDSPVVARCVVPGQPDRWVEISVATIDEAHRDYVISARNITEERRLEALRQEILSLVSHDLRSPLTVVRGYLDILDPQVPEGRPKDAVAGAQRAVHRMETLLDDLLNATRAERAFAPSVMRPVDLGEIASAVVASLRMGTEQELRLEVEPDVSVLGDSARLEQAVTNLVGNAIKHGRPDGVVVVSVGIDGERARLRVSDDGPGIDPGIADRIFDRGVRGAAADGLPGMGLGLYIVRIVAEAHGGSVTLEPHDGPGAVFALELPLGTVSEA